LIQPIERVVGVHNFFFVVICLLLFFLIAIYCSLCSQNFFRGCSAALLKNLFAVAFQVADFSHLRRLGENFNALNS